MMRMEEYTLILRHDFLLDEKTRIPVEEPIIFKMCTDRELSASPVNINEMLDRFRHEVLMRLDKVN